MDMSEDEYEMTSFKRRKVTDDHVSDADSDEPVSKPTQKRRFERKQIDMDDIDILKENEEHGENVRIIKDFLFLESSYGK